MTAFTISELRDSLDDVRRELTREAMEDLDWDGVDADTLRDLKALPNLASVAAEVDRLELDIRRPQLDRVCEEIRLAEYAIRRAETPPRDDDPRRDDWTKPDLSAEKELLKQLREELRSPAEQAFLASDVVETAAYGDPAQQAIVGRKAEWKPGNVAVTDLTRFPQCVGRGVLGQLAALGSEDYVNRSDEDRDDTYYKPSTGAPRDAAAFLQQWEKRQEALEEGRTPASECSNFSYDAIAECLMDDTLRGAYDVLQVGTMRGQHNIAVLVPKGEGGNVTAGDGPLPPGTLIVDPWARAMGQTAEASLFVPPDQFAYANSLYPMTVNFNSTEVVRKNPFAPAKTTEQLVTDFKKNQKMKVFFDDIGKFLELDANFAGATSTPSDPLQDLVRERMNLPGETPVTHVEMNREVGTLKIEYTSDEGTVSVDRAGFLALA